MKNILFILLVAFGGFLAMSTTSSPTATVSSTSVQTFTPLTSVDSASAHYFTWSNNALKKGTIYWLLDFQKAVTDSAATLLITVEQSAQTAPLGGVTQRWYTTDTIASLSGKVATPQVWFKNDYTHVLSGREVRLKVISTDNHNLTSGKVDMLYKPDL